MPVRQFQAIASLCLGVLVFSLQDLILKAMAGLYPVTQAMTIRSVVALPILFTLVALSRGASALRSNRTGLLALRAVISFGAYMTYYMAIAAIPLADAVTLFFVAPLMISLLAIMVLGERLTARTLGALLLGVVGVIIALKPGTAVFDWASLLVLLAAGCYAVAQVLARKLGASEDAAVIAFYQNGAFLIGAPMLALVFMALGLQGGGHASIAFLTRPWVWPSTGDFLLLAACGVIASAGMTMLSQGYRLAPAAKVAVFEYSAILWGPLWGLLFFAEIPRTATLVGAALIIAAGLISLDRGRQADTTASP